MIRRADPAEAVALSDLAIRSKAHWGYTPAQLSVFQRELTLTEADLVLRCAHAFEEKGRVVGFYTLLERPDGSIELEHLFVDPRDFGRGVGRALFEHACAAAVATGRERLVIQSDPNAAGFYQSRGARLEGYVSSSIPGRELPLFSVDLRLVSNREDRLQVSGHIINTSSIKK